MTILELELLSDNLTQTETFYRRAFGLEPYFKDGNDLMFFKIGVTELIFKKSDNQKPVYHFAVDMPNNRFEDAYNYFKQKVDILTVEGSDIADFINWDARSFYFLDNNGNIVEVITRYTTRAVDSAAFSSQSYISVSEIGLVTPHVPQLSQTLATEFGITNYARQPAAKHFSVSGDDNGLFILAQSGRKWYPTQIKAQHFATRVLYMDNGNLGHLVL
ncbi:hypothetical protein AM493_07455 [Flavobacterium akiainvivens]|uniref:VOC domain-containing protein n=1 Tax=Flavobacterium akiainvivens TaxID=1202724 RepID=A0A0M9VHS5_9FLAO|nr:hypothetical protein [Flavobacterium akiainvivens]KOS05890.1 hypothetical protein AM493_07455 [Flavobacterium akiainvivens]SFQ56205.1 Catechol-2,3-dioxygenase [Flavobacterium akiainvivens]